MNLSSSVSPLFNIVSVFVFFLSLCHSAQTSDNIYETEQKVGLLSRSQHSLSNSNATSYSSDTDSEDFDLTSNQSLHPKHPLYLLGLLPEIWDTVGRYLTMRETLNFSMTSKDFYTFYHTSPLKLELLDTALQVYTQEDQTPFFTDTVANKLKILTEITGQLEDMRNDYRQRNLPELVALMDNLFATAKADVNAFLQHTARVRFSPTLKLAKGRENLRYLAEIYTTELTYDYPVMDFFRSYFREKYYFTGGIAGMGAAAVGSFLIYQYFHANSYLQYPMDVQEAFMNQTEMPREAGGRGSCFFIQTADLLPNNKDGLSRLDSIVEQLKMDPKFWHQYFQNLINDGKPFPFYTMPCYKNLNNQTLDCVSSNARRTLFFQQSSASCPANIVLRERISTWQVSIISYQISVSIILICYFLMPLLSWLL